MLVGNRQNKREVAKNIIFSKINENEILKNIKFKLERKKIKTSFLYGKGNSSKIISKLLFEKIHQFKITKVLKKNLKFLD